MEFKAQIQDDQSDEEIDRYLADKSEELEKFAPIDEPDFDQKCRNAYKKYVDSPEFDLLFDNNGYAKKQKNSFMIGLYLVDILGTLDTFPQKDYSPSGIMIAKSLEEYLKDGFLKYLKERYAGKIILNTMSRKGVDISQIKPSDITLGAFPCSIDQIKKDLPPEEGEKWEGVRGSIKECADLRNKKCAHPGSKLKIEDLKTLCRKTASVMEKVHLYISN